MATLAPMMVVWISRVARRGRPDPMPNVINVRTFVHGPAIEAAVTSTSNRLIAWVEDRRQQRSSLCAVGRSSCSTHSFARVPLFSVSTLAHHAAKDRPAVTLFHATVADGGGDVARGSLGPRVFGSARSLMQLEANFTALPVDSSHPFAPRPPLAPPLVGAHGASLRDPLVVCRLRRLVRTLFQSINQPSCLKLVIVRGRTRIARKADRLEGTWARRFGSSSVRVVSCLRAQISPFRHFAYAGAVRVRPGSLLHLGAATLATLN